MYRCCYTIFVCPAKYGRVVISDAVDNALKEIRLEISERYQIHFLEIGTDDNQVHFLVQSVPAYSPTKIMTTIKSITAREVFRLNLEVKQKMWSAEFWKDGYFVNTVNKLGDENTISKYVRKQGVEKEHTTLHKEVRLSFF